MPTPEIRVQLEQLPRGLGQLVCGWYNVQWDITH